MGYEFSISWFLGGLAIIVAAVAFIRFHQWVADNFGSGVVDYERYKLYGVIAVIVGFLTMLNLVPFILGWIFGMIFGRRGGGAGVETGIIDALTLITPFL